MTSKPHNHKIRLTAIPMQYNVNEWEKYMPSMIQCYAVLLFLRAKLNLMLLNSIFRF